jgi:deoxyribodipyrimidine photo-lyase
MSLAHRNIAMVIFHRDLRLIDNTALLAACRSGAKVMPIFVFQPEQISPSANPYFSSPAVQFMCESLVELDMDLRKLGTKLWMFQGDIVKVLSKLLKARPFGAVYTNEDPSIYAKERDQKVKAWCERKGVRYESYEDYGLVASNEGLLPDGRPYTVLAPFYRRLLKDNKVRKVSLMRPKPEHFLSATHAWTGHQEVLADTLEGRFYRIQSGIKSKGGRSEGLRILGSLRRFKDYATERDFPAKEGTTRASAHLRFGTISVREMYWTLRKHLGEDNPLIRELAFREFYMKIYTKRPEMQRGVAFHTDMDAVIPWKRAAKAPEEWAAWTQGRTGFPLVDAGMRQLATEGWMHNRVRMLVASVATRYLYLDWRDCARFFYTHLVDADPFSNTAGWQWGAGVGVDAMWYRPPFNPFLQSQRFDTDAEYIKRWLPELRHVAPTHLHRWNDAQVRALYPRVEYPAPMVEQAIRSKESVEIWKHAALHRKK